MNYLLDTNICIHFFRGRFNLLSKFEEVGIENLAISEITLAELVYGAEKSQHPTKNHKLIQELLEFVAVLPIYSAIYFYGKEKARLVSSGTMIGDYDLLIGCTAVENELIMVTENTSEFERIDKIKIQNWINR